MIVGTIQPHSPESAPQDVPAPVKEIAQAPSWPFYPLRRLFWAPKMPV
jgi:hypothetical protein